MKNAYFCYKTLNVLPSITCASWVLFMIRTISFWRLVTECFGLNDGGSEMKNFRSIRKPRYINIIIVIMKRISNPFEHLIVDVSLASKFSSAEATALLSCVIPEVYLGFCQTSMMELGCMFLSCHVRVSE